MLSPIAWTQVETDGNLQLVVGWRPRRRDLDAQVMPLQTSALPTLLDPITTCLSQLNEMQPLAWQPNSIPEPGEEYFLLHTGSGGASVGPTQASVLQTSALSALVLHPESLDEFADDRLGSTKFAFYAMTLVEGNAGKPISFVRAWDPTRLLQKASSFFKYQGTLKSAPAPDFAVDNHIDLVVTEDNVVVISAPAFNRLFSDVRAGLNNVPATVQSFASKFTRTSLSHRTESSLLQECQRLSSMYGRVIQMSEDAVLDDLTIADFKKALRRQHLAVSDFVTGSAIDIGPAEVKPFLDIVEGRMYEPDFRPGTLRRADRFRDT